MAFVVGKDPQNDSRRVLASTKNNLAKPPKSLMFTLEEAQNRAVRVNWLGDSEVSARDLLATPQDQEHADAQSEAIAFLSDVRADGPVPARDIIQSAKDAGIAEKTLRRAQKVLGVAPYRESEAGKRGAGRWMWKLPIADLVTRDDQDGQAAIQDGHGGQIKTVGHLGPREDVTTRESGLSKPHIQDGHHYDLDGHEDLDGQDGQRLGTGRLELCIHDFPSGEGCYLCDPNHPYRSEIDRMRGARR